MRYVLGGGGFVGSAFVRRAAALGEEHRAVTRDLYDSLAGTGCDLLVNANGNSRKYRAEEDPAWDFDASVRSVMRSLIDFTYDTYVYISSVAVYHDPGAHDETSEGVAIDPAALSSYGMHKYLAEQLVRRYAKRWLIVRLGGVVGPGLVKGPVLDLVRGDRLWVSPRSEFQYIHTDRLAEVVDQLLAAGHLNQVVNVTGRGALPLAAIGALLGREDVTAASEAPVERWDVDVTRADRLVGLPTTVETVEAFVRELAGAGAGTDRE